MITMKWEVIGYRDNKPPVKVEITLTGENYLDLSLIFTAMLKPIGTITQSELIYYKKE